MCRAYYRNLLASPNIADSGRLSMMARSNLAAIYYLKKMAWEVRADMIRLLVLSLVHEVIYTYMYCASVLIMQAIAELKTLTATVMDRLITDCSTFSSDNYCLAHESWQRAWMVLNLLNNTVESSSNAGVVCVESDVAVLSADCAHHVDFIGIGLMHLIIFQRSVCDWEGLEIITMGFLVPETLRTYDQLMADKITVPDGNYISGPTLPFESLLMPVELKKRLRIAKIRGYSVERKAEVINLDRRVIPSQCSFLRLPQRPQDCDLTSSFSSSGQSSKRLVLGYLSYDFNEHPTAHLVEALFYIAKSCRVGSGNPFCDALKHGSGSDNIFNHIENIAFNYGSVAESEYRDRLKSSADKFFDLAVQPHETSANFIAGNQVDILLDMQLYTQGNRAELVASRPAPIVVNYLVYPGTSGSKAHDYIVVDRVVVPPEHSQHYSERLLLLPPSYQVSIYDHLEGMPEFNEKDNIHRPSDSILKICNFNKIDKLDPLSFRMWIQILRRVPQSRLYLLDPNRPEDIEDVPEGSGPGPNEMAKHNLIQELRAEGLNYDPENSQSVSSRMEFYPRVSKVEHVRRYLCFLTLTIRPVIIIHFCCITFIQTIGNGFIRGYISLWCSLYRHGCPSRGKSIYITFSITIRIFLILLNVQNLPVLTIEGDSFPNRVGVSLYESFCDARPYVNNTTRLTETQGSDRACRTACQDPDLLRSILAPQSLKAFEDTAVLLLSKPNLLRKLKEQIALHVRCKHGIFSSFSSSLHFFHGMDAISDVYALYNKDGGSERRQLAHVAVSNMVTLES